MIIYVYKFQGHHVWGVCTYPWRDTNLRTKHTPKANVAPIHHIIIIEICPIGPRLGPLSLCLLPPEKIRWKFEWVVIYMHVLIICMRFESVFLFRNGHVRSFRQWLSCFACDYFEYFIIKSWFNRGAKIQYWICIWTYIYFS